MLLDPDQHCLYIFGGECANESFYELHRYDISTNIMKHVLNHHHQNSFMSVESSLNELSNIHLNSNNNNNTDNSNNNRNHNRNHNDHNNNSDKSNTYENYININNNKNSDEDINSDEKFPLLRYNGESYSNQITLSKTVPDLGYTQRATMDIDLQRVCVFSGYLQNSNNKTTKNSIWLYYLDRDIWEEIYVNERPHQSSTSTTSSSSSSHSSLHYHHDHHLSHNKKDTSPLTLSLSGASTLTSLSSSLNISNNNNNNNNKSNILINPTPRFSCQWIYDTSTKIHYLFGGDPHEYSKPDHRLNDLWTLKLIK